jgi:hypothetical protein
VEPQRGDSKAVGPKEAPKDAYELKKEISRTLKNITYDLERLERMGQTSPAQQGDSGGQSGGQEGMGSLGGQKDTAKRGGGQGDNKPGGPAGYEGATAGREGTDSPGAGEGKEGPDEGQLLEAGGEKAGSRPGGSLYSEKEDDTSLPEGKSFELRLKGDKLGGKEERETLSTGHEVVESRGDFKKHAPTIGVDSATQLSQEQAEDDAIKKTRIPIEYENIIKEIYTGNE